MEHTVAAVAAATAAATLATVAATRVVVATAATSWVATASSTSAGAFRGLVDANGATIEPVRVVSISAFRGTVSKYTGTGYAYSTSFIALIAASASLSF